MPRISVVLPVRNAAETVRESVESIQQQTFDDWELILVDDGSTDNTADVIARMIADDPRIRGHFCDHQGIVAALQTGCADASGSFIARMDGDDRSEPARFERQLALMEANPTLGICGSQVTMFGERLGEGRRLYENWLNALIAPEDLVSNIFVECPIAHPAFFMRREAFEAVGGYQDHGWAEDYDLIMRYWEYGYAMANVPERLLGWREHASRLSMTHDRYSLARFRELKRHYLRRTILPPGTRFVQWGAGRVGKNWLQEWGDDGPAQVVDIHPRKVGKTIHGAEVIPPEALPAPGASPILIAVGTPGAREEIRIWLSERGYRETQDFWFLA